MILLQDFITNVDSLTPSAYWDKNNTILKKERSKLLSLFKNNKVIYGSNTLTGHKDNFLLRANDINKIQSMILSSHSIGSPPWYSEYSTRCIGYAKIFSLSAGMTGISYSTFNSLKNCICQKDFLPKIPRNSSYSSGDVIPASHWLKGIVKQKIKINNGETMALINGNFVKVGYAISLIKKIKLSWTLFMEASALNHLVSDSSTLNYCTPKKDVGNNWLEKSIQYFSRHDIDRNIHTDIQQPVSLRALPNILATFNTSINDYLLELESLLKQPSGNPLISLDAEFPLSQASFLSPGLSLRTSSLIESILFLMWAVVNRTTYILSGAIKSIPLDGVTSKNYLGLIQYPKLMMAKLESARSQFSQRVFATGSSTSYGIEDLWDHGLSELESLNDILDNAITILSSELYVFNYLNRNFSLNLKVKSKLIHESCIDLESTEKFVIEQTELGALSTLSKIFPIVL